MAASLSKLPMREPKVAVPVSARLVSAILVDTLDVGVAIIGTVTVGESTGGLLVSEISVPCEVGRPKVSVLRVFYTEGISTSCPATEKLSPDCPQFGG